MLNTLLLVLASAGVVFAAAAIAVVTTRRRRAARLARLAGVERAALARDEVDVDALAESVGYLARGVLSSRPNVVRRPYRWSRPGELAALTEADLRELPALPRIDRYDIPAPRPAFDDTTGFYTAYTGGDPAPSTGTGSPSISGGGD